MAQYSIGQVEQLTGIKAYILRYWEEVIPCFSPRKDTGGHRIYSQREVDIIRRLNFLINSQGYTIDGARKKVIQETEISDRKATGLFSLRKSRAQLHDLYLEIEAYKKANPRQQDTEKSNEQG